MAAEMTIGAWCMLALTALLAACVDAQGCSFKPGCYQDIYSFYSNGQCCEYTRTKYSCSAGKFCTYPETSSGKYVSGAGRCAQPRASDFQGLLTSGPALTLDNAVPITLPGCATVTPSATGTYSFSTLSPDPTDPVLYVFTKTQDAIGYNDNCDQNLLSCWAAPTEGEYLACVASVTAFCSSLEDPDQDGTYILDSGIPSVQLDAGSTYYVCAAGWDGCCIGDVVSVTYNVVA